MGFGKQLKKWSRGLANTAKFWDPKKVMKGVHQQWSSLDADPLGKTLDRSFFPQVSSGGNSAAGYSLVPGTGFRRYF